MDEEAEVAVAAGREGVAPSEAEAEEAQADGVAVERGEVAAVRGEGSIDMLRLTISKIHAVCLHTLK